MMIEQLIKIESNDEKDRVHIEKINLTKENLLEIEKIDDAFYTDEVTGIDWYTNRYKPYNIAYGLFDDKELVGYTIIAPIQEDLFRAIINGVLVSDVKVSPEQFVKYSDFYYIASSVIKEKYRECGYGSKMFDQIMHDYRDKYLCCLTVSKEGYRLVNKFLYHYKIVTSSVDSFVSKNYRLLK